MAWYDSEVGVIGVALVIIFAITACVLIVYAMRRREKKPKAPEPKRVSLDSELSANIPFKLSRSVQANTATSAKDELRILDLEREILSDAIRRLYEAHAEGKITEAEREKLASSYKARMSSIKESISKDEGIIALHELESMQADLMTLFSERFGELTTKVDELRTRIDVKPIREIPVKMPKMDSAPTQMEEDEEEEETETESASSDEEKPKKKPKPRVEKQETQKTEAEKRIENIRSEVEKVLDRLGQMEIES
jgi:hypothetical protein